jgi:hypothetical protein
MKKRGILGLERWIPQRDARRLIWRHLGALEREMIRCAHNRERAPVVSDAEWVTCAAHDYCAVLQWIAQRAPREWTGAVPMAASRGHLAALQFLYQHVQCFDAGNAHSLAAGRGHLRVIQWMHEVPLICANPLACQCAAAAGHADIVEWELAHGCEVTAPVLMAATRHTPVLRLLLERSRISDALKQDVSICLATMDYDNADSLKLLHAHGFAFSEYVWLHAAQRGNLEALRWLVDDTQIAFFITPGLWRAAAYFKQRHVVQWASERGYALDADTHLWLNVTK